MELCFTSRKKEGILPFYYVILYNLGMSKVKEKEYNSLIEEFVSFLEVDKNYSCDTSKSYSFDLYEFYMYLHKKNLLETKEEDIIGYLSFLNDNKRKRTSISRKISTLKSFYKYLLNKKKITINPTDYISYPKREKKLPNYIEYNELESILKESLKGKNEKRNNLIIELLYASGIRVSELVNIKLSDINYDNKSIRVIGKGNKERIVYFGEYAELSLKEYIENDREVLDESDADWLFPSTKGKHLTTRTIELAINDIMKNVEIKCKVSPHTLRHTFATHMLNSGCDIRVVQELLGHESLNTTEVYTHISNEELRSTYLKAHPRNK